jgi:type VI secretion system secreted protein VgrG
MPPKGPISITTPLGDTLVFKSMTGEEKLGRLFEYQVDLLGDEDKVEAKALLGQTATVTLEVKEHQKRYFNGFICRFMHVGGVGRKAHYRATLRPWLWFLGRRTDCRIYQNRTIPEILDLVFRELGFTDFKLSLTGNYGPWEYCVQYRESYFNFVSRLMEQEGMYYYFKHEDGKHTLVVTDSLAGHEPFPGYETISYLSPDQALSLKIDRVDAWAFTAQIQPGKVSLNDYDFEGPTRSLLAEQPGPGPYPDHNRYEVYDYPGEYEVRSDGEEYAKVRMEELTAEYEQIDGHASARGLAAGYLFTLKDHHRQDQNKQYLVLSAHYTLSNEAWESGQGDNAEIFGVSFTALDGKTQYRAPALTPKPLVYGAQTARVVGKQGEEIWTEEYNRVKVQFHWDRYGKNDETSSCWVRVSQAWAGAMWGGIHIPRIGQEVVVSFLEGDPDRPLITGRVYNKDNMPPYASKPTQSGIKSRSTKGGTKDNFNELRFEDLKGSEQIFVQAEKDMETFIKHDEYHHVHNDRKKEITKNEVVSIGEDRTEKVGKDETITILGKRTEEVKKDEDIKIHGRRIEKVDQDETIEIGGDQNLTITGGRGVTIKKGDTLDVNGERRVHAKGPVTITSDDSITLKTGQSSITMSKTGDISVKGINVTIEGKATAKVDTALCNISGKTAVKINGAIVSLK